MSDHKAEPPIGEPVDEPVFVDDVVGSANEGLADAEAAREPGEQVTGEQVTGVVSEPISSLVSEPTIDVVAEPESTAVDAADAASDHTAATGTDAPLADVPDAAAPVDDEPDWSLLDDIEVEPVPEAEPATVVAPVVEDRTTIIPPVVAPVVTPVVDPVVPQVVTPSEPTVDLTPPAEAAATPSVLQPIFVQAPEPPVARGNRGAAGLVGLVATAAFGVLFMVATLLLGVLNGTVGWDSFLTGAGVVATTWGYWITVVVFFLSFWLLGVFVNRASWGKWVIFGIFVGFASWAGYIVGQLVDAQFWTRSMAEVGELALTSTWAPLAVIAFILGRELPVWFGAWIARIGRRKTELNDADYREYEETIAAGPKVHAG